MQRIHGHPYTLTLLTFIYIWPSRNIYYQSLMMPWIGESSDSFYSFLVVLDYNNCIFFTVRIRVRICVQWVIVNGQCVVFFEVRVIFLNGVQGRSGMFRCSGVPVPEIPDFRLKFLLYGLGLLASSIKQKFHLSVCSFTVKPSRTVIKQLLRHTCSKFIEFPPSSRS